MKKIISILLLTVSVGAMAQHRGHGHHGHGHHRAGPNWGWVAPAIIGGVVTYAITRPPVIVQQPNVVIQPQPNQIIVPSIPPAGYRWEQVLDANCNCYRLVLVQS